MESRMQVIKSEQETAIKGIKVGPAGIQGSVKWDHNGKTEIVRILVSYGPERLHSLQFQYSVHGDKIENSEIIGCPNFSGPIFQTIKFHDSDENVREVEGLYGKSSLIKLCIHTYRTKYTIFEAKIVSPSEVINKFSFEFDQHQFAGFHGTHDSKYVCSIGGYFNHEMSRPASFDGFEGREYVGTGYVDYENDLY